ncbi:MAG: DUF5691 domain-containing protein [Beutenbergiaceae bacterium]
MSEASGWQAARVVSIVGTRRRPLPTWPAQMPGPSGHDDPEVQLLDLAALEQAAIAAGTRTEPPGQVPAPAPPNTLADPPAQATDLLRLLLRQSPVPAGLRMQAITAWCTRAAAAGCHVPGPLLVPLLTLASRSGYARGAQPVRGLAVEQRHSLQQVLGAVIDARGHWLIGLEPRLAAGIEQAVPSVPHAQRWAQTSKAKRQGELAAIRAADPAAGLALLESGWERVRPSDRHELLQQLMIGLSGADEPFLERVLADGTGELRGAAARLLEHLPASARARRLQQVLEASVSQQGLVRKAIEVAVPDQLEAISDAEGFGPAPKGSSQVSHRLQRLITGAPVTFWDRFGSPDQVLHRLQAAQVDHGVISGLISAAGRQRHGPWLAALLPTAEPEQVELGWLRWVEPARREQVAIAMLRRRPGILDQIAAVIDPWSREFSQFVFDHCQRQPDSTRRVPAALAQSAHPGVFATLQTVVGGEDYSDHDRATVAEHATFRSLQLSISEAFT